VKRRRLPLALVAAAALAAPAALSAQTPDVELPLGVGLRLPTYDRVNGASVPWGPTITFGDERVVIDPVVTYRSHLGKFDPSLAVRASLTPDSVVSIRLSGGRGTFTNDTWIRGDLLNSAAALFVGSDARNYFRADRAEGRLVGRLPVPEDVGSVELSVGARSERDWSTGWRAGELRRAPYAFLNRRDAANGLDRPNPLIDPGHITSGLLGAHVDYRSERLTLLADVLGEASGNTPAGSGFRQLTFDEQAGIPTVAGQRLEIAGHLVTTGGGTTPRQRYAYVGGSGTLATVDLLSRGGDQLYFVDASYVIPVPGVDLPLVGAPTVAPRFAAGAADVGGFGAPVQNVGVRLGLGPLELDLVENPRSHVRALSVGFSFTR
jgi:hypothetical protein